MKFILFFCLLISIACCCITKSNKNASTNTITAIGIIDTLPLPSNSSDSTVFYPLGNTKMIYFHNNYRLYRIPLFNKLDSLSLLSDSVIVSKTYHTDTTYYYYARKGNDTIVYKIDSLTDPNFKIKPIADLYAESSVYQEPSFDIKKVLKYAKIVNTYADDKFIIDTYAIITKPSEDFQDSIYLYFSKDDFWKKIPFSFSAQIDSIHNLKFVKGKLISNKNQAAKNPYLRDGLKITFEMVQEKITNMKDILSVFERFEKINEK